jgi:hypothetical protein
LAAIYLRLSLIICSLSLRLLEDLRGNFIAGNLDFLLVLKDFMAELNLIKVANFGRFIIINIYNLICSNISAILHLPLFLLVCPDFRKFKDVTS